MYREMVEDATLDQQVCSCANDVLDNGVLTELLDIAIRFKYSARDGRAARDTFRYICWGLLKYEKYGCSNGGSGAGNGGSGSGSGSERSRRSTDGDIAQLEQEYLEKTNKETAEALLAAGGWHPGTVTGPEQWVTFSAMLTTSLPSNQMIRDFATFIYCKLNHPDSKDY